MEPHKEIIHLNEKEEEMKDWRMDTRLWKSEDIPMLQKFSFPAFHFSFEEMGSIFGI